MSDIVLFVFAGREANMRLQMQWVSRVLAQHPNVRYDVWDLTRTDADHRYLQTIAGDRITVRDDFHGGNQWTGWDDVWRWYAARTEYADTLFIKVDDDVVYFDTSRFGQFADLADTFRGQIVSALTVNNGASTPLIPELHAELPSLDLPLLDVHLSNKYADIAHTWFLEQPAVLLDRPIKPVATDDWMSINCIALSWRTLCAVAQMVTTTSPRHIAGRDWPADFSLGDEGACNMLDRIIIDGITCAHLTFGGQSASELQMDEWRSRYANLLELFTHNLVDRRPA